MNYFLDTNICIFFLKGTYTALHDKILDLTPGKISIPSMVAAELVYGARKSEKSIQNMEKIERFLKPFQIVPFDSDAAYHYGEIRAYLEKKGNIIGFNDLIIAASVLAHNGILITQNTGEFKRIKNLVLEDWT
ncbi:MAG: type II toxin-antitoxin system VapC family toxin [Treponema sp.]|nr:type II toxin-antitoxin system VapC family toxin [Treponema sp.]